VRRGIVRYKDLSRRERCAYRSSRPASVARACWKCASPSSKRKRAIRLTEVIEDRNRGRNRLERSLIVLNGSVVFMAVK
jgi:hypothetical protein